jgi:hypothetical protein
MPGRTDPTLQELLKRIKKRVKSHTTLEILVKTSSVTRNYYFASAALTINGIVYQPQLRRSSEIKSSLTRAADQASVDLQNVDTEIGREFLSLKESIDGATAKIGRYWNDLESATEIHEIFLTGVVVGFRGGQNAVTVNFVSDPYAQVSVGATRRVVPSCQWRFREATTCGYAGTLLTCNFLIDHADGCEGRHGTPDKRAKFAGFIFQNSSQRLKNI